MLALTAKDNNFQAEQKAPTMPADLLQFTLHHAEKHGIAHEDLIEIIPCLHPNLTLQAMMTLHRPILWELTPNL